MSKKTANKYKNRHAPYLARQVIVFAGIAVAFGICFWTFFWKNSFLLALASYIVTVVGLDLMFHLCRVRFAGFVDSEQLLKVERVTPEQLNRYCQSRTLIRLASFLVALLGAVSGYYFGYLLEAFVDFYIIATLIGIVSMRVFSDKVFPKMFHMTQDVPKSDTLGEYFQDLNTVNYALNGDFSKPYIGIHKRAHQSSSFS